MQPIASHTQQSRQIIVVDDELHVRKTIASYLEKHGCRVTVFDNSGDALAAFQGHGCDLVLTDVKMPGMDGVELLGRIRDIDRDVPVVLMTAYANLDMAVNAIKKGAFDFIIKPVEFEYLLAAVEKGLRYRYLSLLEKDHAARLEKAVEEKTRELQGMHRQMVHSEKMAAVGLLSAGVAHEINNPLSFVASNLSTLRKYFSRFNDLLAWQTGVINSSGNPDIVQEQEDLKRTLKIDRFAGDVQGLLDESLDGVDRIKRIVAGLKSFAHKDENTAAETNLNDLIQSTLTIVWNEIKYVAELKKELGDIPLIKCYPSQINQVIMNLLVNAAHAIEKSGTITVRTWADGDFVCMSVADTGCGMSEETKSRIFELFFTTKEVGKGTGLGLPISYDIVRKHGGTIDVESWVGKGTIFTVCLPLAPTEHAEGE